MRGRLRWFELNAFFGAHFFIGLNVFIGVGTNRVDR